MSVSDAEEGQGGFVGQQIHSNTFFESSEKFQIEYLQKEKRSMEDI